MRPWVKYLTQNVVSEFYLLPSQFIIHFVTQLRKSTNIQAHNFLIMVYSNVPPQNIYALNPNVTENQCTTTTMLELKHKVRPILYFLIFPIFVK